MNQQIDLAAFWTSVRNGYRESFKGIKDALGGHPAHGETPEAKVRELLSLYLPRRYMVESGFVIDAHGGRSPNMDVLVADCHNVPPLCVSPSAHVFAAESVAAAVEVTAATSADKLEEDFRKLAQVRELGQLREYLSSMLVTQSDGTLKIERVRSQLSPGPRAFMFTCGDDWVNRSTYQNNVRKALKRISDDGNSVWLHAAFSLRHGLLAFRPHTDFECWWIDSEEPLLDFIVRINASISDFITDTIDMRRYLRTFVNNGLVDPAEAVGSPLAVESFARE